MSNSIGHTPQPQQREPSNPIVHKIIVDAEKTLGKQFQRPGFSNQNPEYDTLDAISTASRAIKPGYFYTPENRLVEAAEVEQIYCGLFRAWKDDEKPAEKFHEELEIRYRQRGILDPLPRTGSEGER